MNRILQNLSIFLFTPLPSGEGAGERSGARRERRVGERAALLRYLLPAACCLLPTVTAYAGPYDTWSDSAKIELNTTVSGANVSGTVSNFPVLIRLTSSNFTFDDADAGKDIRFTGSDGSTVLDYEIERWDDGLDLAEIWVEVPSVIGNNNSQYVIMYWGKSGQTSASSSANTFSNSFVEVWHLSGNGNASTGNDIGGTLQGDPQQVSGTIGYALDFDGEGDRVEVPTNSSLSLANNFTISCWVKPGSTTGWRGIVEHGRYNWTNAYGLYKSQNGDLFHFRWSADADSRSAAVDFGSYTAGNWYHIAGTFTGGTAYMYVNGSQVKSDDGETAGSVFDTPLRIGCNAENGEPWIGSIDEVRVSSNRSANWIKLSYQNQRPDQTLVTLTPFGANSAPTNITLSDSSIAENSAVAAVVGTLRTEDSDNDFPFYYLLAGGPDDVYFQIADSTLSAMVSFDYEIKSSYTIRVSTDDGNGGTYEKDLTITVTDVDEAPVVTDASVDLADGSGTGTSVHTVVASDPEGLSLTYAITAGNTDSAFGINTNTGEITVAGTIDSATRPSYTLTVSATDPGLNVGTGTITVTVRVTCTSPTITSHPSNSTADEGARVTISVAAAGTVSGYQWEQDDGGGWQEIVDSTSSSLTITAFMALDSMMYRCQVTGCETTVDSDPCTLFVNNTVPPNPTTGLILNTPLAGAITVRWATPESNSPDADSVWVYYSETGYPDTGDATASVAWQDTVMTGDASEMSVELTGLTENAMYYFSIWISDVAHNKVRADTGSVETFAAGAPFNPLVVSGVQVDSVSVRLTLRDFCAVPQSRDNPLVAHSDTAVVWYRTGSFVTHPDSAFDGMVKLSMGDMKDAANCPDDASFDTLLSVPQLEPGGDSSYYFSASLYWNGPGLSDLVPPIQTDNGDSVLMFDTGMVSMALSLESVSYVSPDILQIGVGNTGSIDPSAVQLGVWYGFVPSPDFSDVTFTDWVAVEVVAAMDPYEHTIMNDAFDDVETRVYYAIALKGGNGRISAFLLDSTLVGRERPVNNMVLDVEITGPNDAVLTWGAGTRDSLVIWYGTDNVPLDEEIGMGPYTSVGLGGSETSHTIGTLEALTWYSFGIEFLEEGLWSFVSATARDSGATPPLSSQDTVANRLSLDSLAFDETTNGILAWISLDTSGGLWEDTLQVGIDYAVGAGPVATEGFQVLTLVNLDTTVALVLDEELESGEWYHVVLWLREKGTPWSPPTDSSSDSVFVPRFTWEYVKYLTNDPDTTETAFGGMVTIKWPSGTGTDDGIGDTLRVYDISDVALDGFATVGGVPFTFTDPVQSRAIEIGMRYGPLPEGVLEGDIAVYRDSGGVLCVVHDFVVGDSTVWISARHEDLKGSFVLLADTSAPEITVLSSLDDPFPVESVVRTEFLISDNVGNLRWRFLYGAGNEGYTADDTGYLEGVTVDTLSRTIKGGSSARAYASYGLRILLVVSDGVSADTANASRQIILESTDEIAVLPGEWVPLRASGVLEDNSFVSVLAGVGTDDGSFCYDPVLFRAFRWYGGSAGRWIEYADSIAGEYAFTPGRVIWLKTAQREHVSMGQGVTSSLRQCYEVPLPPLSWTDFALPYKFSVRLGDILDATGVSRDSLEFYEWSREENEPGYTATELFVPALDSMVGLATLRHEALNDAYTVYNPDEDTVFLRIPPVPPALSRATALSKRSAGGSEEWEVRLNWSLDGRSTRTIRIASREGSGAGVVLGPLPPSFVKAGVAVFDAGTGVSGGYAIHRGVFGGMAQEILFYNRYDDAGTFAYDLSVLGNEVVEARFYDPVSGEYSDGVDGVATVSGNSNTFGWVVAGTHDYLEQFAVGFVRHELLLGGFYPNPFRHGVSLRYTLPYDRTFREVRFGLYDLLGKGVWHSSVRSGLLPGPHTVSFALPGAGGSPLAAGVYILRMSAIDTNGATVRVGQIRVSCVR